MPGKHVYVQIGFMYTKNIKRRVFLEAFTQAVADLRVGNGLDEGTEIGPLINEAAVQKGETTS
ncbi:hypothetical protein GCM10020331_085450 [Ectobacillus funiculus]